MYWDKTSQGYEVWHLFDKGQKAVVEKALTGGVYAIRHAASDPHSRQPQEERLIRWSVVRAKDAWGGCWKVYVTAAVAVDAAQRLINSAMAELLAPGTRVRLLYVMNRFGAFPEGIPAGTVGTVVERDWESGVKIAFDGYKEPADIGKYWVWIA